MEIRQKLTDGQQFDCPGCHRAYRVLLDASSHRAGFVPIDTRAAGEPLGLPRGSVRAVATLATAGSAWILILAGLVGGYFFARLFTVNLAPSVAGFVNHLKGTIVLGATIALAALLLMGLYRDRPHLGLGLACTISFYFGSRS